MRRRLRDDSGETLVESLISIGVVGVVIVALVGGVMFAGSASTMLKAEGASIASGRSLSKALSAYRIPATTPWLVGGQCNPALVNSSTGSLPRVVTAALNTTNGSGQKPLASSLAGPPTLSYAMVVAYPDNGVTETREEPCDGGAIEVDRTAGEAIVAMKVTMQVTALGHLTSRNNSTGETERVDAEVPATVTTYLYRGLA